MDKVKKFIGIAAIAGLLGGAPVGKEVVNADEPTQPRSVLPSDLRDSLPPVTPPPPTQAELDAQAAIDAATIAQAKQELYDLAFEYCTRVRCPNPEQYAREIIEGGQFASRSFDELLDVIIRLNPDRRLDNHIDFTARQRWESFISKHPDIERTR